jgi:hypothetical protein
MQTFPNFSNVKGYIKSELDRRVDNPNYLSSLNVWIRASSGVGDGLVLMSNPDYKLLSAAGDDASIYGNDKVSGVIGKTWTGGAVYASSGQGYRPSPTIESLEISEGAGGLSREASFSIKCYTEEQMQKTSEYFMEPGYTIFLEWGWNTEDAYRGWQSTLSVNEVAKYQSFNETTSRRESTAGHYDNYFGFITGGDISIDGDKWTINVKCKGYGELPATYLASEAGTKNKEVGTVSEFKPKDIESLKDVGQVRFMKMFNSLPSTRKVASIKVLVSNKSIANPVNFLNFEDDIAEEINKYTDGRFLGLIKDKGQFGDLTVKFPIGTKLVTEDRFIRFGTLIEILNRGINTTLKLGNKEMPVKVNTDETPISGFKYMFSTDAKLLFIPNKNTPKFSTKEIVDGKSIQDTIKKTASGEIIFAATNIQDNSVTFDGSQIVSFPNTSGEGLTYDPGDGAEIVKKSPNQWGYLNDLYVNFDFAKSKLKDSNLLLKDALYEILNGMSQAVNGFWDFQIVEKESKSTGITELRVQDMTFVPQWARVPSFNVSVVGNSSVFLDTQFSVEVSGQKMNQVIAERNNSDINSDLKPIGSFSKNPIKDKVLLAINDTTEQEDTPGPTTAAKDTDDTKGETLELFLNKITLLPKAEYITNDTIELKDIYDACYFAGFDDKTVLSLLKATDNKTRKEPSPLLPIDFTFTMYGISGFRRGDLFTVKGLPKKFDGFFQVKEISHSIQNMKWTTQVVGGYRANA